MFISLYEVSSSMILTCLADFFSCLVVDKLRLEALEEGMRKLKGHHPLFYLGLKLIISYNFLPEAKKQRNRYEIDLLQMN